MRAAGVCAIVLLCACGGGGDTPPDAATSHPDAHAVPDAEPSPDAAPVDHVNLSTFQSATLELGQPDFTSGPPTPPVANRVDVAVPYGQTTYAGGTLFVPGSNMNRVMGFHGFPSRNGEPADFVLGQPDFATTARGTGADGMGFPQTVIADAGHLYILDYVNGRVVGYASLPSTDHAPADFVIGQTSLTIPTPIAGCARAMTNFPDDISISGGKLMIGDIDNNRMLIWNTVPTTSGVLPDLVLGQSDFDHCARNDDDQDGVTDATPSARTLAGVEGAWTDGTRLFVADQGNNRVLVWNTFPTSNFQPADFVLGQPDFTTSTQGTGALLMSQPFDVGSNGTQLAIDDSGNHRVLVWNQIPTSATAPDVVLGQGDFDHGAPNDDDQDGVEDTTPSARSLSGNLGIDFAHGMLIISDTGNNRIVFYGDLPCPSGQYEPADAPGTCVDDPCQPDPCNGQLCRNDSGTAECI